MFLLVSDYDNTFYTDDIQIKKNILAVKKFIKNNLFVIATGRSYKDFMIEQEKYNIPCKYVILNHGAIVLKDNEVLNLITIDNKEKERIIPYLNLAKAKKYFGCSIKESRLSLDSTNLSKMFIRYYQKEDVIEIQNNIRKNFKSVQTFIVEKGYALEIVSKEVDKANAILKIACEENIEKDNIYTIGDGHNDINMIKKYRGYSLPNSVLSVKLVSLKQVLNVASLIEEILKLEKH